VTLPVDFTPEAEADVGEAHVWYLARGLDLGEEFLRSLDACIQDVSAFPEALRANICETSRYSEFFVEGDDGAYDGVRHEDPRCGSAGEGSPAPVYGRVQAEDPARSRALPEAG